MEIKHGIYNQSISVKLHNRVNENQFDGGITGPLRFNNVACGREIVIETIVRLKRD